MSSIVPGYNYDIFISYRQKDNKYDGWVTKFVDNLRKELEATFKEDISVYFDENPHDRLQETHNVNKSLEGKLKCLVFIPVLSQTYCDPASYAWQNELLEFIKIEEGDYFGKDVRLRSGNVAGRILPVRIHDLDPEDVQMFEEATGTVLRALDFVFKTASGVNRPLLPEDEKNDNLNKTLYRDQINKVAGAIKDIILGMKSEPSGVSREEDRPIESLKERREDENKTDQKHVAKISKVRYLIPAAIVAILVIAGIIAYPKIFPGDTLEKLRSSGEKISVAVMPFQNLTNDTTWNVWQNGIQINLITSLSNTDELKVRQTETINDLLKVRGVTDYASLTPSVASSVSKKLDSDIFIYGSINQAGSTIRVNMQLIDSKTREIFKSYQIDGSPERILNIVDSISSMVNNFLIISRLEKDAPRSSFKVTTTTSPEAYRYFINGGIAFDHSDYPVAVKLLSQALEVDSNFIDAAIILSYAYFNQNMFGKGKEICLKVYAKREQMPFYLKIRTNFLYSIYFETTYEQIECLKQMQNYDDQIVSNYFNIATLYYDLGQYEKAIPEVEKYMELYKKLDLKPSWPLEYVLPAMVYHKVNQYDTEKKYYRMAERNFPDDPDVIFNRTILELTTGDTASANKDIRKYISVRRDNLWTEADITSTLASIYSEAGMLDKAEEYYRKAALMQQDNPGTWSRKQINNQFRLNNLAWFLIDKNRNINEGLELVNKELEVNPEDYLYLDCKGWGLYKQGKYDEALKFLEKSWSLRPVYIHEIYLHLEAAKKAVTN